MTNYHVQYSAEAVEDLRNIYQYIAVGLQAPQAAQGQVDRIRKMIRSLSLTPTRFAAVEWEPWASMGMRKVPVNNYLVFYLVENADLTVTVVRIFLVDGMLRKSLRTICNEWRADMRYSTPFLVN